MNLNFETLEIEGSANIQLFRHKDKRGGFTRLFREQDNLKSKFNFKKVENIYISQNYQKSTLRGFHRQKGKFAESKIMSCVSGSALHVLIRINGNKIEIAQNLLSYEKGNATYVPRDCFSAYLTLEDNTTLAYLTDNLYSPDDEDWIRWNDPCLPSIDWPIKPKIISDKDQSTPLRNI